MSSGGDFRSRVGAWRAWHFALVAFALQTSSLVARMGLGRPMLGLCLGAVSSIGWTMAFVVLMARRRRAGWPMVFALVALAAQLAATLTSLVLQPPKVTLGLGVVSLSAAGLAITTAIATSPAYEIRLGWRYLQRRTSGHGATIAVLISLVGVIVGLVALLGYGKVNLGAGLLIPCAIALVFAGVMRFCSIFTTVSIVGVALGVAALVVVLSVMSGFQQAFRQKVLGVNAHIVVLKYGRDFSEYRDVLDTVRKVPHVAAAAPFVFEEMMLSSGHGTSGTLVKGIDTKVAGKVIDLEDKLVQGKLTDLDDEGGPDTPKPMIIGKELAKKLKVKMGDRLRLVVTNDLVPSDQPSGAGQTASREFRVVGIFYAGFDEYDRHLAYVSLKDAQNVLGGNDYVTGVEMRLDDMDQAPAIAKDLVGKLGGSPFRAIDWQDLNHNLFEAVHTQKLVLSIFLTIIVVVAAFNVVAALSVLVVDKTREVAILKSMGLSPFGAARVFQVAGLSIGLVGTTLGVGLGLLLCAVVTRFSYALDPHVYLIDHLPVLVSYSEIAFTVAVTFAICAIATLYPAYRAASLEPVDGLRAD